MSLTETDPQENSNLILLNCCQDMGKRFCKVARSYEKAGDHATAEKLRLYAREQFSAVRQVCQKLKMID
jgi:hypothetical protein